MTSKINQRVTSVLACVAIAVLLAIIIVVWVQVGHGAFKPNRFDEERTIREDAPNTEKTSTQRQKETPKRTHLEDFGQDSEIEYVKPVKISPLPLHDQDIIYDQLRNAHEQPVLRHHSGHFRHKTAEVWDPHPRYEIGAFGEILELELTFNDKFISPTLEVTHFRDNFAKKVKHDPRTSGCFYTGKVKGDPKSDIAVSLCNGMTGYIRTSKGNYHIEPAESFDHNATSSILHRIQKVHLGNNEVPETTPAPDLCEIKANPTVLDDDFALFGADHEHLITKRDVRIDYLDNPYGEDPDYTEERRRSTRDLSWTEKSVEFIPIEENNSNQEYHIATMVVADKKMAQYHNTDEDLIHYILTLMSHVALLYKDATIGNPISLAVVRIWILKDTEFKSTTSEEMLRKFCEWQSKHIAKNEYDTALLLTRESICKNSTAKECNTLGVAEVGSMCSPNSSCTIVKDKGLPTSYIIAHELGHLLSMPHDDDERCPSLNNGEIANNIMSKMLQKDTKPWLWSPCSKHFITEFLASSRASCLFDTPNDDFITSTFVKVLPGETFEVDRQCELEFGKNYKLCSHTDIAPCASLFCTTDDIGGCITQHMPWADGTKCGEHSWCHHGECIPMNRNILQPVAGAWGDWKEWGPCSTTCGGGVKVSKRDCDSPAPTNGGAYCTGLSVKYSSCNHKPCDPKAPDFREVQCAEFNGMTKGILGLTEDVKWVPKYGMDDPDDVCKLYCRVGHSNAYYKLKEKVIDGTKCGLNTFDICVNGLCKPGGCDNRLASTTTLDECGVCGGDNSKCEEIAGTYNVSSYGYNRVVRLPKGCSNIYIGQRGYANTSADDNFLALVDGETGTYILNGNFVVSQYLKDVFFGGMTITYSGSKEVVEFIKTPKNHRLTKDLILEVLSVGRLNPPDITYRYTIQRESAPRYGWHVFEQQWTHCNSICSGKQYLRPLCIELATSSPVEDNYCSDLDMNSLVQQRDCNTHCRYAWNVVSRSECSSHCGQGARSLRYNCLLIDVRQDRHFEKPVNEKHCSILPKPADLEVCTGLCDSTHWMYGEWSQCTKSCGGGTQYRTAKCLDRNDQILHDSECNEEEKTLDQICNNQKCPIWSVDDWTPCSVTCGKGYRTRPYYCHVDGHNYNIEACDRSQLPIIEEECDERPCVSWSTGNWGDCNVTCGEGHQHREVSCRTLASEVVNEEYCKGMLRPTALRTCHREKCEELAPYNIYPFNPDFEDNSIMIVPRRSLDYRWVMGAWSECTKPCENGTKSRMVVCQNEYGKVNDYECNRNERPVSIVECGANLCPKWSFGAWSNCDSNCIQHRQVSCQHVSGAIVKDDECDLKTKPFKTITCNNQRCIRRMANNRRNHYNNKDNAGGRFQWKIGRWGPCSKSCGRGLKTRPVRCIDNQIDVTVVDQYCRHQKKPKTTRNCEKRKCDYVWIEEPWSECSPSCGEGFKYRDVSCHKVLNGGYVDPNPLTEYTHNMIHQAHCDFSMRPPSKSPCTLRNCDDSFYWSAGSWGECSHSCGKRGKQRRTLHCFNRDHKKVKLRFCAKEFRPKRNQKCNRKKCMYRSCKELKMAQKTNQNRDYYLLVSNRPALVYCYKMDTQEPEEFISLKSDYQNFAEMYDKSLNDRDSCPLNGERQDDCDCMPLGPDRSGSTVFWKIRLNITSLNIITNDFTFSRQIKGKQISYGTAGDCYSKRKKCIQGRFSISLADTSFRLSSSVRWITNGNSASSTIDVQEKMVDGKCGGYCGSCLPDPNVGLVVEVT